MHPKSKKICLIAAAFVIMVTLLFLCKDMLLVVAIMSALTNILVFANLGHNFIDEMFDDNPPNEKSSMHSSSSDARPENNRTANTQLDGSKESQPIDYFPDTYTPSRNTGHIPYYENPLLESSEMFPTYYGDTDTDVVAMELRRIRDRQAIEGAVSKTPDHFKAIYRSEFADEESKPWWGNAEY